MALCDVHFAGCGEHLPALGLRDDRIPGTDQAVRGGRHGQKLHSGFPPRKGDARSSADARLSWQKVQRQETNRRRHRLTEPTTKALCQPPPPPQDQVTVTEAGDHGDRGWQDRQYVVCRRFPPIHRIIFRFALSILTVDMYVACDR